MRLGRHALLGSWLLGIFAVLLATPACDGDPRLDPDPRLEITLESSMTRAIGEELTLSLGVAVIDTDEESVQLNLTIEPSGVVTPITPARVRVSSGPSIQVRADGGLFTFDYAGIDLASELDLTCVGDGAAEVMVIGFLGELDDAGFREDRDQASVTITCGSPADGGPTDGGVTDVDAGPVETDAGPADLDASVPDASAGDGGPTRTVETAAVSGLVDLNRVHAVPDGFGGATGRSNLALARAFSGAHLVDFTTGEIVQTLTSPFSPLEAVPVGSGTVLATRVSGAGAVLESPFGAGDDTSLAAGRIAHVAPAADGSDAFTVVDGMAGRVTLFRRGIGGAYDDTVIFAAALLGTLTSLGPGSAATADADGPTLIAFPGSSGSTLGLATASDAVTAVAGTFPSELGNLTCVGSLCAASFHDGFDDGVITLSFDAGGAEADRETWSSERVSRIAMVERSGGGASVAARTTMGLRLMTLGSDGTIAASELIPESSFQSADCTAAVHPSFAEEDDLLMACFNESALLRLRL